MEQDKATAARPLHLLLITYPSQGHLVPAVDFARALADTDGAVSITVVVTTTPGSNGGKPHVPSVDTRSGAKINTLILPFPSRPSLLAGMKNGDNNIFRVSFGQVMQAMADLQGPILKWARAQPHPPDAIVSDMFLGWTNSLAAELGVPRLVLCSSGALPTLVINFQWREMPGRPGGHDEDPSMVTLTSVPGSLTVPWGQISTMYRSYKKGDPVSEFIREGFVENLRSWGWIVNTFEALEENYLESLKRDFGHSRVWAVGPLYTLAARSSSNSTAESGRLSSLSSSDELLQWLDTCPDGSVVYISFGSQTVLDPPQIEALAAALELSGVRFIWCTRSTGKVEEGAEAVPEGFEERTAGRGVVLRRWAPQVAVLEHPAVGSFLSHCGWNSVLEAVAAGVMLLTWPTGMDQFSNARLVVDDLKVGVRACEGQAVPDPDELAAVLRDSLGSAQAAERARMVELKQRSVEAVRNEDGTSCRDMHAILKALREFPAHDRTGTKSSPGCVISSPPPVTIWDGECIGH